MKSPGKCRGENMVCKVKQFPFDSNSILAERVIASCLKLQGKAELKLKMSPMCLVTLDPESKRRASIPENAVHFSWCYSISSHMCEMLSSAKVSWSNNVVGLLMTGAFVYFDEQSRVIAVHICGEDSRNPNILQFGSRRSLGRQVVAQLTRQGRWAEVTLQPLLRHGAVSYCWINPLEIVDGKRLSVHGGFAYLFHSKQSEDERCSDLSDCFFPVVTDQC